jgi:hypothetical protein
MQRSFGEISSLVNQATGRLPQESRIFRTLLFQKIPSVISRRKYLHIGYDFTRIEGGRGDGEIAESLHDWIKAAWLEYFFDRWKSSKPF